MSPDLHGPAVSANELPASGEYTQLAMIADPDRLAPALESALAPSGSPRLLHAAVTKLHYRPGRGCWLVIEARFASARGGSEDQLYFGRLLAGGGARRELEAGRRAGLTAPRFGPASLYLADWELLLWAYPNDPELPGLALLADP